MELEQVGNQNVILSPREFDLLEWMIRVEQELKDLKEAMDKRFEAMDKRFEAMDKRFALVQWTVLFGFTLLGVMISVYKFIP